MDDLLRLVRVLQKQIGFGAKMDDLRSVRSAPKVKITYLIAKKATRSARGRALSSTMVWTVVELLEKISVNLVGLYLD
ncbi:hypothetical protein OUZ56_013029 [Daphnia magna]|uniref:Uncharacterized protein n=1 Tax=Daphnia magna TaxID=35525 RepID=A0ABQ9Z4T7_9CRUS|nr:hypothetical protein OUZ56_013029 [Daphnia magna]